MPMLRFGRAKEALADHLLLNGDVSHLSNGNCFHNSKTFHFTDQHRLYDTWPDLRKHETPRGHDLWGSTEANRESDGKGFVSSFHRIRAVQPPVIGAEVNMTPRITNAPSLSLATVASWRQFRCRWLWLLTRKWQKLFPGSVKKRNLKALQCSALRLLS